ncbi:MAG TPA: hypothetical protein DDX54_04335 [Rhodospirillaceae bacterium]|jgi:hypothetical protein|nr:pentapeptide repeat-containing protein [Alphaproteobacteria bacterium]HBH26612.1 hypothetical protein [Rhodospirillaceae bacterium]
MPYIHITSHETGSTLFGGEFPSLRACLEAAVAEGLPLIGADLAHAGLQNANLDGAHLARARLDGANLTGANLSEARLDGTSFRGAELYNTCLAESLLREAAFEGAAFGATDIAGADIAGAMFSTASCFTLDFALARSMEGVTFATADGLLCQMSRPPTVIRGQWGHVIAVMDHHVKVGPHVRPLPWRSVGGRRALVNRAVANAS